MPRSGCSALHGVNQIFFLKKLKDGIELKIMKKFNMGFHEKIQFLGGGVHVKPI